MRSYLQFCPIARTSEIMGERWTLIIVRNLVLGCTTFNEIADGAPGISRTLLSGRLRELERAGIIRIRAKDDGHGSAYELTQAGREMGSVLQAIAAWGARWLDMTPPHANPGVVLWAWCTSQLERDRLPDERVVVRFEFTDRPADQRRYWVLFENRDAEVCYKDPGFPEDLGVEVTDSLTFANWHLGQVEWGHALRSRAIQVTGPRRLAQALPTWNRRPDYDQTWTALSRL